MRNNLHRISFEATERNHYQLKDQNPKEQHLKVNTTLIY